MIRLKSIKDFWNFFIYANFYYYFIQSFDEKASLSIFGIRISLIKVIQTLLLFNIAKNIKFIISNSYDKRSKRLILQKIFIIESIIL